MEPPEAPQGPKWSPKGTQKGAKMEPRRAAGLTNKANNALEMFKKNKKTNEMSSANNKLRERSSALSEPKRHRR